VTAGKPDAKDVPVLGGYESYARVLSGVLNYTRTGGFLANLESMYNEADTDTPQWEGFLDAWQEYVGPNPTTIAEVIGILNDKAEFRATLPDSLAGKDGRDYSRRLGNALSRKNGVRFTNGLVVEKAATKKHHAITWRVAPYTSIVNVIQKQVGTT
jgi:hypothetical protein